MSTDITPRDIAIELMLDAARDVDALTISERLDETSEPDEADGFAEQVAELIRTATVTVGWPATEQVAEANALDLDAIEARTNAATPGPWEHGGGDGLVWGPRIGDPVSGSTEPEDADFIAAARTVVPALVAEVRRLREQLAKPCGSCHPCTNWADETWRRADRKPPAVSAYDDLVAEVQRLREERAAFQPVTVADNRLYVHRCPTGVTSRWCSEQPEPIHLACCGAEGTWQPVYALGVAR